MASPIKSARNLARKRGVFVVCGAIAVVFLALVIAAMAFAGPPIPPVPQGNVQFRWMGDRAVYMRIASSAFSLWGVSAYLRCLDRKNRIYLAGIAIFLVFWMLDAIIKWKTHSLWLGIFCWYFYYVPMTVIPLLTLLIDGRAAGLDRSPAARNIKNGLIALACALIVLVFSNNLHQLVFSFDSPNPGVVGEYEYRGGYWLFMIWNVLCYAGFFVCLARASRKHLRTFIAIIVGVFLVGVLYMLGYVFRLPFAMRLNFSLVYALLVVTALELSLDLGLIPSMVRFDKSFAKIPLDLRIVDLDGKTYLATTKAESVRRDTVRHLLEELAKNKGDGAVSIRTGEHEVTRVWPISGGAAILAQDVSGLDHVHAELEQVHAELLRDSEVLGAQVQVAKALAGVEAERKLVDEVEAALATSLSRAARILDTLPEGPGHDEKRRREVERARMLVAYSKRKGSLVLSTSEDPELNRDRIVLIANELASDLRVVGIDCAAVVDLPHALATSEMSTLYDCIYDFAFVALDTKKPSLLYHLGTRPDGTAELRAVLESDDDDDLLARPQAVELERALEARDVIFVLSGDAGELRLVARVRLGDDA